LLLLVIYYLLLFACYSLLITQSNRMPHPFGTRASREANILAGRLDLSKLRERGDDAACHLVSALVQQVMLPNPKP